MSYIDQIEKDRAQGKLAELYARVENPDGTLDNVMKVHSLNPRSLEAHFQLYVQAMHRPSPLSRAEREMVATVVSRLNGCDYCLVHHRTGLEQLLPAERRGLARALSKGDSSALDARERALVTYAEKLTREPNAMDRSDVERLRAAGLDDRSVLDLAQCIGYFNYVNRLVTGLGVALGEGEGDAGQWPE